MPSIPKQSFDLFKELNSFIKEETNQNIKTFNTPSDTDYLAQWYNTKTWKQLRNYSQIKTTSYLFAYHAIKNVINIYKPINYKSCKF